MIHRYYTYSTPHPTRRLECDLCGEKLPQRCADVRVPVIYSEAKADGWRHYVIHGVKRSVCPACLEDAKRLEDVRARLKKKFPPNV